MANIYDVPGIEGLLKSSNTTMGNLYNVATGSGLHEQAMRDYLNPFSRNQTTQITEGPVADYMADYLKSYIDPNNQAGGKFGERRGPNQMQVTGLGESPNPFTASGIARAAEMAKDPSFQAENLFGEGTLTKVPGGYDYTGGKFDFNFAGPLEEMIFAPSSYNMKFNEDMTPLKEFDRDFRNFSEAKMGELPSAGIAYSELDDFEAQNAGSFIPKEEKGILSLRDILADLGRKGVEGFKDVAGRGIASQGLGTIGTMLTGNPLIGGIASLAGLLTGGDMFNSPYIGAGAATVDEYGNMYSAEQLNKMNAKGGYYTDPARASRRRDKSIERFRARNAEVKGRYANLLAQQAKEEAARQSAADAMQDLNRANRTGGYQSMHEDTSFMEGPDTSKGETFSSVQGST